MRYSRGSWATGFITRARSEVHEAAVAHHVWPYAGVAPICRDGASAQASSDYISDRFSSPEETAA